MELQPAFVMATVSVALLIIAFTQIAGQIATSWFDSYWKKEAKRAFDEKDKFEEALTEKKGKLFKEWQECIDKADARADKLEYKLKVSQNEYNMFVELADKQRQHLEEEVAELHKQLVELRSRNPEHAQKHAAIADAHYEELQRLHKIINELVQNQKAVTLLSVNGETVCQEAAKKTSES